MKNKPDALIKSMLGDDFFDVLKKSDVYKMYNQNATSIDEMSTGLKIVPRAVMSFLISHLSHMEKDDNKELELPFAPGNTMYVIKKDRDTYNGHFFSKGKKVNEFLNRSLPGIGLVLMTTFELYDTEKLKDSKEEEKKAFDVSKLQDIIDERLKLHSLICSVVDQKIAQRDAVESLIKEKLSQALTVEIEVEVEHEEHEEHEEEEEHEEHEEEESKSDKLKDFLKKQKEKLNEAHIEKTECIDCPDCGTELYKGGKSLTLCICYGEDWNKNIKIQKMERNIKMKFPKSMDKENIEMLLDTLKHINKD